MTSVTLHGVSHRYRRHATPALDGIDLNLGPGITGLVGINGAGKSTLMRIVSGGLVPTAGTVRLSDADIYDRRERRTALARVALMPQAPSYPKALTALEFVSYLTWMRGIPRVVAGQHAQESIAAVGLENMTQRKMGALSGGMVRRVWLAQALAAHADVLVLDEPSTGLDPRQRSTMVRLLSEQTEATVLLSSHILEDVAELADRVVVLHEGRIIHDGPGTEGIDAEWFLRLVPPTEE